MDLIEAIEDRRTRLAFIGIERKKLTEEEGQLEHEIDQLETAVQLVEGFLGGKSTKPPPRVRAEKTVRAEPAKKRPAVSRPNDTSYARCGHPRTKDNSYISSKNGHEVWVCKTCTRASQARRQAKKSGKTPKSKSDEDPVRADVVGQDPVAFRQMLAARVPPERSPPVEVPPIAGEDQVAYLTRRNAAANEPPPITPKKAGLVLSAEERVAMLKRAEKWKGQCSALNDRRQRCGLLFPHDGDHNASGRPFTVALPAGSALPRRELDDIAEGRLS